MKKIKLKVDNIEYGMLVNGLVELRNKLLNLVIYKILYSKESTMDINYKRAICYINEITKIFPDLNVEKDTLDNYRFVKGFFVK